MEIKIGDRTIPMLLTAYELQDIQKDIGCTVGQLADEVFAIEYHPDADEEKGEQVRTIEIMKDANKIRKLGTLIRICGNAGLEEAGQEPDLTDKWIMRHIKIDMVLLYAVAMMKVINEAMRTEIAEKEAEDGPVDEILAEENRKKEPGN